MLLQNGWGGHDGRLLTVDSAHYLSVDQIELAAQCVSGTATAILPIVYVSARSDNSLAVNADDLAFRLGGLAHVVEPESSFSFRLRELAPGKNPYGGAIGVALPGRPNMVRFVTGENTASEDTERLYDQLYHFASNRLTKFGWDWTKLQEEIARASRVQLESELKRSSNDPLESYIAAFDEEIRLKDAEIADLRSANERLNVERFSSESHVGQTLSSVLLTSSVPQLYSGEIRDRVRRAFRSLADNPQGTFSSRDVFVFGRLLSELESSSDLASLRERIKQAGREGDKVLKAVTEVLLQLGFSQSSEKNHVKFDPPNWLGGVEQIVLAKTPSDHRAAKNTTALILRNLGLNNLGKEEASEN